ncbi:DUF2155 domain-containing protein [Siccirubricoccus phaeus]|uniref:DUF2155 domain-containing protein n=1 Tax=Siccirubricoccus phaeus TaxID=2595053 RepID=UPI001F157481|nr:DUF2155 domain-containing protein [Siccirubricoccus phaeus]
MPGWPGPAAIAAAPAPPGRAHRRPRRRGGLSPGRAGLLLAALLVFPLVLRLAPAAAQDGEEWQPKRTAELQLLDKVTARISVLRATVGQPASFGTLSINIAACNARPPDEVPDAAAWMEVRDSRRPAETQLVFRGWMFANNPAVSMLEHPVYDLRILECK